MLSLTCISDTHLQLDWSSLPPSTMLIHAGDALNAGQYQKEWLQFLRELESVRDRYTHALYVPGNHDIFLENNFLYCRADLKAIGVELLCDQLIEIEGITFYGFPHVPYINGRWAFEIADRHIMQRRLSMIPEGVDVLISHGPPKDILADKWGCPDMQEQVLGRIKPRFHIFGHVHSGYGQKLFSKTTFYNVAICTESYKPTNAPTQFEIVKCEHCGKVDTPYHNDKGLCGQCGSDKHNV